MLRNVAIDLSFVNISALKALWDVLTVSTVKEWINFFFLTPPVGVDDRIDACRAGALYNIIRHVRVINLEPLL